MASTLQVNTIGPFAGNDVFIETAKTITGAASQFKITGGTTGQVLTTDGNGLLSFTTVGGGGSGGSGDFSDGGEAGTANRTLGNTDAFAFGIETNNINRLNITADGIPQVTGGMDAYFNTINTSITTPDNYNVLSAGPIDIAAGVNIDIGTNSNWTLV
jgi:hypothetical protein